MNKYFIFCCLLVGSIMMTANAQNNDNMSPRPSHGGPSPEHFERMHKGLNLSSEQKEKIHQIMENNHKTTHDQIRGILTDEQKVKFDKQSEERQEIRAKHREERKARRESNRNK